MDRSLTPDLVNDFIAESFPSAHRESLRCVDIGDGFAVARWTYDDSELRPGGYISGPRLFGVADMAFWISTFTVDGLEPMTVTSEMSIRFLRPARHGNVIARAEIDSLSRRRIVATVRVWIEGDEDRLVAVAQGTYARP